VSLAEQKIVTILKDVTPQGGHVLRVISTFTGGGSG